MDYKFGKFILSIYFIFLLITTCFFGMVILDKTTDYTSAGAKIIYVDAAGNGNYTTIQAAVDNATSGDTISVANGTYYEAITIDKSNITIIGNCSTNCKIIHHYDGTNEINDYAAAFNITSTGVNISGLNITVSGNYTYGIRLNSSSSNNARISNNNISS